MGLSMATWRGGSNTRASRRISCMSCIPWQGTTARSCWPRSPSPCLFLLQTAPPRKFTPCMMASGEPSDTKASPYPRKSEQKTSMEGSSAPLLFLRSRSPPRQLLSNVLPGPTATPVRCQGRSWRSLLLGSNQQLLRQCSPITRWSSGATSLLPTSFPVSPPRFQALPSARRESRGFSKLILCSLPSISRASKPGSASRSCPMKLTASSSHTSCPEARLSRAASSRSATKFSSSTGLR
mmetsp:Transcript_25165/g.56804  ORF Transcript_25165/g.56804 Transcript_25165/m.56804 type:complete len:238 (+) Transcript_25165:123-836(+)